MNHSNETFSVRRGDRIAQIVFQRYEEAKFIQVEQLPGTLRGNQGFGSTGVN
ncbi:MAG: hypothetical protein ACKOFA_00975 [Rhodoluna sp.]